MAGGRGGNASGPGGSTNGGAGGVDGQAGAQGGRFNQYGNDGGAGGGGGGVGASGGQGGATNAAAGATAGNPGASQAGGFFTGGPGGGGGNGGAVGLSTSQTSNTFPIQGNSGGDGGKGGDAANYGGGGGGGGGGAGGHGLVLTAASSSSNTSYIQGAAGGNGGAGGTSTSGSNGSYGGSGGDGGDGGTGVLFTVAGTTFQNSGTISGGTGGGGGAGGGGVFINGHGGPGAAGAAGAGGVGVSGASLSLTTSGSIAGGGGADAIDFTAGASSLTLQSGFSLTGGIGVTGSLAITAQSGGSTLTSVVHDYPAGAGSVTLAGGQLTLAAVNTYTGGTTINSGATLTATNVAALGTGAVTDNGALVFSGATGTVQNAVSGSGSLAVSGVGSGNTLTFSGALTNDGGVVLGTAGNIAVGATGSIVNATFNGSVQVNGTGDTVSVAQGGTVDYTGNANRQGVAVHLIAAGTLNNEGLVESTGTSGQGVIIDAGATINNGDATNSTARITATAGSGVLLTGDAATTVNNYGRIDSNNAGLVQVSGTGSLTVSNLGANADIDAAGDAIYSSALTLTNTGNIVGGTNGIENFAGVATITNAGTIAAGTYNSGTNTTTIGGQFAVKIGSGSVTNSGTIQSGGASVYQTSTSGTLNLVNTGTIGGTARTVDPDDTVVAEGAATVFNSGTISTPNYFAVSMLKGGTLTNAAGGQITAGTAGNRYGVDVANASGVINNYGSITSTSATSQGITTDNNAATITLFAGSTTGQIQTGSAADTLTLYNGAGTSNMGLLYNTVTGATSVGSTPGANQVVLQNAGTLAAASFTTLNLGGGANTVTLAGAGDGTAANGAAGTLNLANVVTTGGTNDALGKSGTGVWTLTGVGTFTGATTVSAGTLAVDASAYASAITVNGGALRGTGVSQASVTVQSSGLFTPGEGGSGAFTTTALALNAGGTLGISASGGATTSVNAGSVTLGGALNFAYTGGAEAYGTTYEVVNNTGAAAVSGTFSNYAQGATLVSGGETFQVSYSGGTGNDVVLTDVTNTAPTITGANGAQTTNDKTPDHPFSTVVVTDPDAGQTQTTTVSFTAANGTLAGLGAGVTSGSTVTYTVTGSASAVTAALQAATFTPTQNQVTPGQTVTTTFTIGDTDGHGGSTSNAVTQVTTTSVNDAPTAANGSAGQAITDKATATPFAQVTVGDPDPGQTETATITYTAANGVLSGTGLAGSAGNYTLSAGSAAALQSALDALTFTPTANQVAPGATVQTAFTVSVSDGTATGQTTDTVTATSVNDAPVIAGGMGGQTVGDRQTINPFATVTVTDPDTGQGETVTVTLSNAANGVLTGGGFTPTATPGVYTVMVAAGGAGASAAQAQADLRAAVFTPTQAGIGTPSTQTTFTVAVNDGAATATDNATQVTATHTTNTPPTLGGFAAGQTTTDKMAATPFANATVADPDAQTETVTVTLSAAANGTLAGGGFASVGAGSYQVTAASAAAAQADLRALVFTPTMNQVAPGQTVTTGFTVAVNDTQTTVQNTQTSEVVTSVNDAPTLAGTHASATSDHATVNPFSGVTVGDPDTGQGETVTVTLSNPANGTLTGGGFVQTATPGVYTATETAGAAGASAAAAQAALQAVVFTPTQAPAGTAATTTTLSVSVSDGTVATATDSATVVTATHTTNTPVAVANATPAQATNDKATAQPFAGVTVTDPDTGQTETATITYAAANGTLAGTGLTGAAGSYTLSAGSAAALQTALDALVFTPTMNQVAPGQTVATTFAVSVSDGATTAQTSDTLTVTSVNDAPAFGSFQTTATAPADGPVVLQPTLTVTDPDVGAAVSSAQVSISSGFLAGDRFTVTPTAGITAAYNAATGVLTLTGGASDAAYQQTLETVAFLHDGTVDAGTRTVTFTVTDDQGAATSAGEAVSVGGYIQPSTGGGGGGGSVPTNLDVQQAFPTQTSNLLRTSADDPALQTPTSPLYAQAQAEKGIAAALDSGQLSLADAQNALYHLVDGSTSVAEISYAFFTGKTPTQAGLNYLVHSAQNATDLNDPYYAQFTTENRYINFANNLATGPGAGAAAFQASYGALSLTDATAKAYAAIFGTTPTADKITAILTAQVSNGLGGTETRAQYFSDITGGSAASQKAAAIGFLLADSVKEGFGLYQQADLHFLQDLAHGTAVFNIDLLATYTQAPSLVGQPVADPTIGS